MFTKPTLHFGKTTYKTHGKELQVGKAGRKAQQRGRGTEEIRLHFVRSQDSLVDSLLLAWWEE